MADSGGLPADCLNVIFTNVLAGPTLLSGLPLKTLASRWFTLRLTCRHWAAALERTPVSVDLEAASPAALSWLSGLPVRLLRVGRFGALRERRTKSAPALTDQPTQPLGAAPTPQLPALELSAGTLLAPFQGCDGNGPLPPCWDMASFTQLQVLHLKGSLSPSGEPCAFSTAPLAALPRLRYLHLERFTHYDLSGLPPSLRMLRLRYQEAPMYSSQAHPPLDIPRLPPATRLSLLDLDSRASLGLLAGELLAQCQAVAVRATRCYLGVPMPAATFGETEEREFHWSSADGGGGAGGGVPEGLRRKGELMLAAAARFLELLAGGGGGLSGSSSSGAAAAGQGQPLRQGPAGASLRGGGALDASAGGEQPAGRLLECIEFSWMCANSLVFVPLRASYSPACSEPASAGTGGGAGSPKCGDAAEIAALESAQAAVHEGEEPVVEVPAAQIAELAAQRAQQGGGAYAVRVEHAVGHQQAELLRLECWRLRC